MRVFLWTVELVLWLLRRTCLRTLEYSSRSLNNAARLASGAVSNSRRPMTATVNPSDSVIAQQDAIPKDGARGRTFAGGGVMRSQICLFLLLPITVAACQSGPDVPHPVESRDDADCRNCHTRKTIAPVDDHNGRSDCVDCHKVKSSGTYPPLMPHIGGDVVKCVLCHEAGNAGAKKTQHLGETDCYSCHAAPEYGTWPSALSHQVTESDDASCLACHSTLDHKDRTGCVNCHEI